MCFFVRIGEGFIAFGFEEANFESKKNDGFIVKSLGLAGSGGSFWVWVGLCC